MAVPLAVEIMVPLPGNCLCVFGYSESFTLTVPRFVQSIVSCGKDASLFSWYSRKDFPTQFGGITSSSCTEVPLPNSIFAFIAIAMGKWVIRITRFIMFIWNIYNLNYNSHTLKCKYYNIPSEI